jgi:hypothetical protein
MKPFLAGKRAQVLLIGCAMNPTVCRLGLAVEAEAGYRVPQPD